MRNRRLAQTLFVFGICAGGCRFGYEISEEGFSPTSTGDLGGAPPSGGDSGLDESGGQQGSDSGGSGTMSGGGESATGGAGTGGGPTTIPDNWWDDAFRTRIRIDIDNTDLNEELSQFPVAVRLLGGNFDAAKAGPSGEALRFIDNDHTTELAYEIEASSVFEDSVIWVRVPSIPADPTPGHFWLYYDNVDAASSEQAADVWSNGYLAVLHLNEDYLDSTSGGHDGNPTGSANTVGQAVGGISLNGTTGTINMGNLDNVFQSGGTMSIWNSPTATGNSDYGRLFDKASARQGENGFAFQQYNDLGLSFTYRFEYDFSTVGGVWVTSTPEIYGSGFRSTALTFNALAYNSLTPATFPAVYVDGAARAVTELFPPVGLPVDDSGQMLQVGNFSDGSRAFLGDLDELRISNTVRSAAWIAAEHHCMDPGCTTISSFVETLD